MGYVVIDDECISCGTCRAECPSEAIVQKGIVFRITEDCIECGTCIESCPSGAIVDA